MVHPHSKSSSVTNLVGIFLCLILLHLISIQNIFAADTWTISYDDEFNTSGDLGGWSTDAGDGNFYINIAGGYLHLESNWGTTFPMIWRNDLFNAINSGSSDYAVEIRFRRPFLTGYGSSFGVGTSPFTGTRFNFGDPTPVNIYENIFHNNGYDTGGGENVCAGTARFTNPIDYNWHVGRIEVTASTTSHYYDGALIGSGNCRSSIPASLYFGNSYIEPQSVWSQLDIDYIRLYTGVPASCTPTTVTTYFSPDGGLSSYTANQTTPYNIVPGQTNLSVSANSSSSNLTVLNLTNPVGQNNPTWPTPNLNQWYPISGAAIAALGTYSVNATGGGINNYCLASNTSATTAYFSCHGSSPVITAGAPFGTLSAPPSSFNWTTANFGQDQCGTNNTTNDTLTVTFYNKSNGASGGGTAYVQCTYPPGSSPTASAVSSCPFANNFTFPPTGGPYNYSWQIDANNGATDGLGTTSQVTNFVYNPGSPAWWQTGNGYVFAQGRIGSLVPSTCTTNCFFNTSSAGSAAVVSYDSSTPVDPNTNFNGGSYISSPQWFVQASSANPSPSYDYFFRQIPADSSTVNFASFNGSLNHGVIQSNCTGYNECYLLYNGAMSGFNTAAGSLGIGSQKVVVFVPNGATPITLKSFDPGTTPGQGFFGLVASGPLQVDDSNSSLSGLYFTDSTFSTCTQVPCNPQTQLTVTGSVLARGSVNLQRNLGASNKTTPTEVFNYDPSLPFILPRALRRLQFQINEILPSQ